MLLDFKSDIIDFKCDPWSPGLARRPPRVPPTCHVEVLGGELRGNQGSGEQRLVHGLQGPERQGEEGHTLTSRCVALTDALRSKQTSLCGFFGFSVALEWFAVVRFKWKSVPFY